jgi:hypothetical protein
MGLCCRVQRVRHRRAVILHRSAGDRESGGMIARMKPDRYRRAELQAAYERGYHQMHDHTSAAFRDGMEMMVEYVAPNSVTSEGLAAAYEGGADALRAMAARAREAAKFERSLRAAEL